MDAHTDGRQMEVVEQHRQMVVKATSRMKVQLQVPGGGQCQGRAGGSGEAAHPTAASIAVQAARPVLLPEPELQLQRKLGSFDGLLQVATVNCKKWRGMMRRAGKKLVSVLRLSELQIPGINAAENPACKHPAYPMPLPNPFYFNSVLTYLFFY